jgi:hypothetical protein
MLEPGEALNSHPEASPTKDHPMSLETTSAPTRRRRLDGSGAFAEDRSWSAEAPSPKGASHAPTRTFRLPGGKTMTLSTDRVRAKPAVSPQLSFVLGQNAIGLGLWGLLAPRSVNRFLGLRNPVAWTRALFGARELATGMALFSDPTKSSALWARVAGDVFDIAVLSALTHRANAKRGNAKLALGVVLAVTALDVVAAVRMTNVERNCA